MPSNHLILCRPLLFLPSIFPSIRVFSNESVLCIRFSVLCAKYSYQGDVVLDWTLWGNGLWVPENVCYTALGSGLWFTIQMRANISHFEWHWYISSYSLCLTNIDSNPHNKTRYYCFPHFTDGDLDVGSRMNSPRFLLLVSGWTGFEHRQMALQTHTHAYTYIHAFIKYKLLTPGKHCPSCKFVYLFVYTLPFPWKYLRQFTRMYKTWQKNLKRERSSDCSFLYLPQEGSIVLESTCMRPNSLQFCPTLRPHGL